MQLIRCSAKFRKGILFWGTHETFKFKLRDKDAPTSAK